MSNFTNRTQPSPVAGTTPHTNTSAPSGTVLMTAASCNDGGGGCVVAYPVPSHPYLDTRYIGSALAAAGSVKLRYATAAEAARDLAWWPTSPAPRIGTQEEADAFFATYQHGNAQDPAGRL